MKAKLLKIGKKIVRYLLYLVIFWHLLIVLYAFLPVLVTPLMIQRWVVNVATGEPAAIHKTWRSLDKISENMQLAAVCAEDQKFLEHEGFDMEAIEKALKDNQKRKKKGKPIRGASTISQQTAKNVFLFPSRSWFRKGLEVYFTFWIELLWSKERILEVYLNVAETGENIYGVEAAARQYFDLSAAELSPTQAANIAAILPNPRLYSATKPSGYVVKRRNWILRQMAHWGEWDVEGEGK